MQIYTFPNATELYQIDIVFQSKYYTVARASVRVSNGEDKERVVCAEGLARRSWKDPVDNPTRGKEIAEGRALKALSMKLNGRKCRKLLMNG